ncbi:uncharacterized protein K452DRAFT_226185 [Aplosporella prunicola CBS 121167]|uniref:AB hydrolase-1 domain-containing protein n=1 Tax=Aplosporella prunicola CBS 121167 TaxID=1176127 RepID=A0A6A6BIR9_9PEZI|nr:uncharacterized protein K452DRAFT_226185 [Aplosporella prunicola CBS 121167]KAF2142727.1 hypothetical protein K452DRAFT_226185 [Aplosporella prunicola CBS 121167]
MSPKPTIVLVPGAAHSPAAFAPTTALLHAAGYDTVGVPLPSVGASPPLQNWAPDVARIRDTVAALADAGRAIVLFAHSYGGLVACEAVRNLDCASRQHAALPGGVLRIVFCAALIGEEGSSLVDARSGVVRDPNWDVQVRVACVRLRSANPASTFYNDVPADEAARLVSLLRPHSFRTFFERVTFPAWKFLPSTYIVCENDRALPLAVQERLIASAGEGVFAVERCDAGHSPFVSQPGFVARVIRRAAGEDVRD